MAAPFQSDLRAILGFIRHVIGAGEGESLFGSRPFGRITGGHWTGYPLCVLILTAVGLLTTIPIYDGWLFFGGPIVFGPVMAWLIWRFKQPRVLEESIPRPMANYNLKRHGARLHLRTPKSERGLTSIGRLRSRAWAPQDGHVRPFGG